LLVQGRTDIVGCGSRGGRRGTGIVGGLYSKILRRSGISIVSSSTLLLSTGGAKSASLHNQRRTNVRSGTHGRGNFRASKGRMDSKISFGDAIASSSFSGVSFYHLY